MTAAGFVMQGVRATVICMLALLFLPQQAGAYVINGTKWANPTTVFYVDIAGGNGLWNDSFETAMSVWNNQTVFDYRIIRRFDDPCSTNNRNGVGWKSDACGSQFGSTTLAVTLQRSIDSTLVETDIVFNNSGAWDVYSGPWAAGNWLGINDFQRVAIHELGHALGLGHEDDIPSVMSSSVDDDEVPREDDIAGVSALYVGAGTIDCLAAAPITLDQTVSASLDYPDCTLYQLMGDGDLAYYDLYKLTLLTADTVTITMQSDVIDTYLGVFGEDFLIRPDLSAAIAINDDANELATNSLVAVKLEPGTYIIVANSFADFETGSYTLRATGAKGCVERFCDVPADYWAASHIERLAGSGITSGCGDNKFCPESRVTRAQMAVFLERGIRGDDFSPGPPTGNMFLDVPADYWAARWIELLSIDGITSGCGTFSYCPDRPVRRDEMAVFLLRAMYGQEYKPPAPTGKFNDVSLTHWSAAWIEQLAAEGITSGCGNGDYCSGNSVTRAQMAVFLVRIFGL